MHTSDYVLTGSHSGNISKLKASYSIQYGGNRLCGKGLFIDYDPGRQISYGNTKVTLSPRPEIQ